jgi:two-component sensor histidine kinase
MHNPVSTRESNPSQSSRRAFRREQIRHDVLTADLNAARARALALTWERAELLQRQFMMARQFDRRRAASLQMIATLLAMQGRAVGALEAALQLNKAANCVIAFAQAHDRLDVIDARHADDDGVCPDGLVEHIIEQMSAAPDAQTREIYGESRARPQLAVGSISREWQEESS